MRVVDDRDTVSHPGRQGREQTLEVVRMDQVEATSPDDLRHLQRQQRIVEEQFARARARAHPAETQLVEGSVNRKVQRIVVFRDVIGDELDLVSARAERFREALDAQRRAAACRHRTGGDHGNAKRPG